jgi:hypothetical protein
VTAPIFAVWPLNSCHAAQRMPRNSARYALRFVRRAVMNAPNTKWSIVSNALKPVTSVLKNAGKWQRNNNDHPLPMTTAQQVEPSEPSLLCGGTQSTWMRERQNMEEEMMKQMNGNMMKHKKTTKKKAM